MNDKESQKEKYKQEIFAAEKEFEKTVKEEGLAAGFTKFAAEDAVLLRGDTLITGKSGINTFYTSRDLTGHELEWTPDFIDVAESGDLAYTYGKYIYRVTDTAGSVKESRGYFHSVWKRMPDGQWRFVWD